MSPRSRQDRARWRPVGRVLPLLGLAHVDRYFDYLIPEEYSEVAIPGVRVRVRFGGRLVDALLVERIPTSEFEGTIRFIERVISPYVVYPPQIAQLVEALARRYAGIRSDIIRAAIPPRNGQAEKADTETPWLELGKVNEPDLSEWSAYMFGASFVDAVIGGATARAAWQTIPGQSWAGPLAALAVRVAKDGGGVLIVVPDQRDVDQLELALRELVGAKQVCTIHSSLGPQARYRRYLSILAGQSRLVIGTRSAAFAPVVNLRLAVIVHDGDESLIDPRTPYVHAREVLSTRSAIEKCSLIVAGYARTAETQLLVESGWMHDVVASRDTVRAVMPRIRAAGDSEFELQRDPRARSARLPSIVFEAAGRALARSRPVLFMVPRKGYVPTLVCARCRAPSRCRFCNGPLGIPDADDGAAQVPTCRWCGRPDGAHRCGDCGSPAKRAAVIGSARTAEELGRAFPTVRVLSSGGQRVVDAIPDEAMIVVSTPGAEPVVQGHGGYGAVILLDGWAMLGRSDLRSGEDTMYRWAYASAQAFSRRDGGEVIVVGDPGHPIVQELIRWDVVGSAHRELANRQEVQFPPAVHMAAIDGSRESIGALIHSAELPDDAEVLGPVDMPREVRLPGDYDEPVLGPPQRVLIRCPLTDRDSLGVALRRALTERAARKDTTPLRVQIDPRFLG